MQVYGSNQVSSHNPSSSACWLRSPDWNVLDIQHTCFCSLICRLKSNRKPSFKALPFTATTSSFCITFQHPLSIPYTSTIYVRYNICTGVQQGTFTKMYWMEHGPNLCESLFTRHQFFARVQFYSGYIFCNMVDNLLLTILDKGHIISFVRGGTLSLATPNNFASLHCDLQIWSLK